LFHDILFYIAGRYTMRILVVYDSVYGNTEKIARAIGKGISDDVKVLRTGDVRPADLDSLELFIIGAPTYGGRPTPAMKDFLKRLTVSVVKDTDVATFDTRISAKWVGIFGYAAGKIAKSLRKMGGNLLINPEGFFVMGTEGPLKVGEIERASAWAQEVINKRK
jgi:flavodoxin I